MLFFSQQLVAQELHFSQYFNSPLMVNPANTGFNPDYDYRVGGNYRNQWANIISNPYQTSHLWADAQLFTNKIESGWAGIGASLYEDGAGSANLKGTKGYVTIAYHQMLGNESLLSLGFGFGAVNKRIDKTKLTFDNQWNGKFFDSNNPIDGGENFAKTSVTYFDMQVGLNYAWFISDKAYFNAGLSLMHVNKPSESFFSNQPLVDNSIPIRYTFFLNGNYKIGNLWIVNPNLYYSNSARTSETVIGMNANRNLNSDATQQLIVGLYYRNKEAIIPLIGYQINDLKITVNYDVTTSSLSNFNNRQGGYEASIIKSGLYNKGQRNIKCPTVKF